MAISLLVLVVALYAAVATAYGEARRRREPPPRWARLLGPFSVGAHLAGLLLLSMEMNRSPFATGSQALSFLAFSLVFLYLVFESTSRVASHGGGFYALAAVLAGVGVPGLVEGDAIALAESGRDTVRSLHVGLSLLTAAAVLAGGLLGIGYLGTYRRVKRASLGGGIEGPSLSGFERLSRMASLCAVLLLVPAGVFGAMVARRATGSPTMGVMILTLTGIVLVLMLAGSSFLWWRRPRRGSLASWLNVSAALLLIVAFVIAHPLLTGGAE